MHEFAFPSDARYAGVRPEPVVSLFALGLWIRLGFVGAMVLLAALVSLVEAETPIATALGVASAGALLAAVAWHRVRSALREDEPASRGARLSP